MTRAEMLAELRDVLNAAGVDTTWTDTQLLGYLSEGQDVFCERTGYFTDISNFSITLQTGVAAYAIPARVIQILDIWNGSVKLKKVETNEVNSITEAAATGLPSMWQTDRETGVITLWPTPSADYNGDTFVLQVWRYSQYDLAGDGAVPEGGGPAPDAEPEIPSRFHRACIEWAAYKAFNHHDIEKQDPVKASDHLMSFRLYVDDARVALRRVMNIETRVGSNPAYRT